MPSRLQVRITRQAISPRLAIRILSNRGWLLAFAVGTVAFGAFAATFGAAFLIATFFFAAFFLAAILTVPFYRGRTGPWPRRYGRQSAATRPSAPTATMDSG